MRVCVRACVRACVRVCVRACVCVCVRARTSVGIFAGVHARAGAGYADETPLSVTNEAIPATARATHKKKQPPGGLHSAVAVCAAPLSGAAATLTGLCCFMCVRYGRAEKLAWAALVEAHDMRLVAVVNGTLSPLPGLSRSSSLSFCASSPALSLLETHEDQNRCCNRGPDDPSSEI